MNAVRHEKQVNPDVNPENRNTDRTKSLKGWNITPEVNDYTS